MTPVKKAGRGRKDSHRPPTPEHARLPSARLFTEGTAFACRLPFADSFQPRIYGRPPLKDRGNTTISSAFSTTSPAAAIGIGERRPRCSIRIVRSSPSCAEFKSLDGRRQIDNNKTETPQGRKNLLGPKSRQNRFPECNFCCEHGDSQTQNENNSQQDRKRETRKNSALRYRGRSNCQ